MRPVRDGYDAWGAGGAGGASLSTCSKLLDVGYGAVWGDNNYLRKHLAS